MRKAITPSYGLHELLTDERNGRMLEYLFFWGHQPEADGQITASCLSQWWMTDFTVAKEQYCCMEQYMMAEKARLFEDDVVLAEIMQTGSPNIIKALGRKVCDFKPAVWDEYKYGIVVEGNLCKFAQNPKLKAFLLGTGDKILVEASPYDAVWGIKMNAAQARGSRPLDWRGQNLLGFALMEVRAKLRDQKE